MPGSRLGNGCILGEGTLIPPGSVVPDDTVLVGRPPHGIRSATDADRERVAVLRQHQTHLTNHPGTVVHGPMRAGARMGRLYAYRDKTPSIGARTVLFDSAEITGDVIVGEDSLIGAGVRSSVIPTVRSGSAPGCRSWRTRCCICCPATNWSSTTTSSSAPAR